MSKRTRTGHWQPSAYIRPELRANTLEKLERWSGDCAPAAINQAQWRAVTVWLMSGEQGVLPDCIPQAASLSVLLWQEADRVRLDYPRLANSPRPTPRLLALAPELQDEAKLIAGAVLAQWEQAGRPYLANACIRTQQYIHLCRRQADENNKELA